MKVTRVDASNRCLILFVQMIRSEKKLFLFASCLCVYNQPLRPIDIQEQTHEMTVWKKQWHRHFMVKFIDRIHEKCDTNSPWIRRSFETRPFFAIRNFSRCADIDVFCIRTYSNSCCQINFNATSFLILCTCLLFDMLQVIPSVCLLMRLKVTK